MNIFLEIATLDNINAAKNNFEYVVGLEGISLRAPAVFSYHELDQIIEKAETLGHSVAINACKIFHEDELGYLKDTLTTLKDKKVKHIFFSDLAVYMIARELNMEDLLIYNATTYLTNTKDVNHYLDYFGSVVVSPDLLLREQIEIIKETKKQIVLFAFGKYSIFHSRRNLLTDYLQYRNIDKVNPKNNKKLTVVEELRPEHYPIIEDENGAHIFIPLYYCLLKEINLFNKSFDLYLSTNFLNSDQTNFLARTYDTLLNTPEERCHLYEKLQQVIPNLGEGIRNQKTFLLKKMEASNEKN